ncbi:hypothetical protein ATO7_09822 [Oceanococcus atlanticus]|uniref:Porin n=1 Tax=Oceanococcus atlanticus TaxID=1317117 RepID=A0A1Y1SEB2_9GAMM|nr:DcaP family trimeric outer membrane transporter [Oceanococcus atlanticus]ORE87330.1 hypothetical protein ATO7_09822 [Oceanococcus atlanticus]RZO87073.1 MAG: porin [Oceanococcus sp.]
MKIKTLELCAVAMLGISVPALSSAASIELGDTTLTLGGYLKLDAMVSDYEARPSASLEPLGRDYYVGPRGIPLDDGSGGVTLTDFHVKQSRLWIKSATKLSNGETLGTHLELDFQNSGQGNETISHSYSPRLRQAFLTYGNWLFGQAWSTFQNVGALPETLDFIGPTESTVFIRQPMIRYTTGRFQLAVENPETRLAGEPVATTDDNRIPDFVARFNVSESLVVAALARSLESQDGPAGGVEDSTIAGGLSVSGKVKLGRDDIKYMVTAGTGLGRYLGVLANLDANVDGNGEIDPIDSVAAFVAYRHFWNDKARSSLVLGTFDGDGDIETASSVHLNYLYSPVKALTYGVEFIHALRENADGSEGSMNRLQFSAKLGF